MVNKKIVIICTIIALIITVAVVVFEVKKFKQEDYEPKESYTYKQNNENENQIINELQDENIITDDTETNTQNTQSENNSVQENENQQSTYQGEEETKEETENGESKALKLAQEEWGEDDTVYYTVDNQSGNVYIISVRSKINTRNAC